MAVLRFIVFLFVLQRCGRWERKLQSGAETQNRHVRDVQRKDVPMEECKIKLAALLCRPPMAELAILRRWTPSKPRAFLSITCLFCCVLSFKKPSRKAAIVIPLAHSELQSGADRLCCLLCKRRLTPGNDDTVGEESTPPNPPLRQHDHRRPPRNTNPPFTERQGNASRRF